MVFPGGYDQCRAISTPCEVLQGCEDHSIPIPGKNKNKETMTPKILPNIYYFQLIQGTIATSVTTPASLCHSWLLEKRYPDAK